MIFVVVSSVGIKRVDCILDMLFVVLGFNDMSTLVGHFGLSPREKKKRDRRDTYVVEEMRGTGKKEEQE